jgi:hypothetical protein
MTAGDEQMAEASRELPDKYLSKIAQRHPNQTRGIIAGWQEKQ